jgi:hypothetical protein
MENAEKLSKLDSDLLLFHGLFQSYRRTDRVTYFLYYSDLQGIVLNVDVSFYVALDAFNLLDWLKLRARKYTSLGEALNDPKFRERTNKELKGMEVSVTYGYRRKYRYTKDRTFLTNFRLEGLDMNVTPKLATFTVTSNNNNTKNNTKMNVVEYMKQQYKVNIKNDSLPLLLVRPKAKRSPDDVVAPTWLVPELCEYVIIFGDGNGDLDFQKDRREGLK